MPRFLYFASAFAINSHSRIFSTGRIDDPIIDDRTAFDAIAYGGYQMLWSPTSVGYTTGSMHYASSPGIVLTGNNLANVLNGGNDNDTLNGLGGDDTLKGLGGNDTLKGGAGKDLLDGGVGSFDLADYSDKSATVVVTLNGAINAKVIVRGVPEDTIRNVEGVIGGSGADVLTGDNLANRFEGNGGNDTLRGAGGNDTLDGSTGNDTLDGGTGADIMRGGAGNDLYIVDNAGDTAFEKSQSGIDTVRASVSFSMAGRQLEHLVLTGSGHINGIGNSKANTITGNGGRNALDGGTGNDTLNGLGGNDTLDGGTGADEMRGGSGTDLYMVDNAGDIAIDIENGGIDTVLASVSYTLTGHIERLELTGTDSIDGTGNPKNNIISGNAGSNSLFGGDGDDTLYGEEGNDTLNGGAGADILRGGAGDDLYIIDSAGANILETRDNGIDTVRTPFGVSLAGKQIENIELTGLGDVNVQGNPLDNTIIGNVGDNSLNAGKGDDILDGGDGNDTLFGKAGNDMLNGGEGNDTLDGGGAGDVDYDTLNGGPGNDTMKGGLSFSNFIFDTALQPTNVDTITDFSVAYDTISLDNFIFTALTTTGTLVADAFFAGAAAQDASDRIIYNLVTGELFYDADGSGTDAAATQFATVMAGLALTNADFVVF